MLCLPVQRPNNFETVWNKDFLSQNVFLKLQNNVVLRVRRFLGYDIICYVSWFLRDFHFVRAIACIPLGILV